MDFHFENFAIMELAELLETIDLYTYSEYCSRNEERKIEEICNDTYRLLAKIIIENLTKAVL